jgi:group I intron endonuclease
MHDFPVTPGIYKIENTVRKRVYVGSAKSLKLRREQHLRSLNGGYHKNARLQNSWNKYGAAAFSFTVLEHVQDVRQLVAREQHYIDSLGTACRQHFNICPTAGSHLGLKASAASRTKMSIARKGKKLSPEHIAKVAAFHRGRKRSPETQANISAAKRGKPMHPKTRSALLKAAIGSKRSEQTRARMSSSHKGKAFSEEHRRNLSLAMRGNTATKGKSVHTEESRKKLSDFAKANDYISRLTPRPRRKPDSQD